MDDDVLSEIDPKTFYAGSIANDNLRIINSLDISEDGSTLATASNDDGIHFYNVSSATKERSFYERAYGVSNIKFTPKKNIIYSSTKGQVGIIRELNADRSISSSFQLHLMPVTSIDISLYNTFISAGRDNTLNLWDLNSNTLINTLKLPDSVGDPIVKFDPSCTVIFVAHPYISYPNRNYLKLFDVKMLKEPFAIWDINTPLITNIDVSDDGRIMSLSTDASYLKILDALGGSSIQEIRSYDNSCKMSTASLSPDGKYVAVGSEIHSALKIFDAESGFCVNELIGHPRIPCKSIWSREYGLLVSACYNVIFWLAM